MKHVRVALLGACIAVSATATAVAAHPAGTPDSEAPGSAHGAAAEDCRLELNHLYVVLDSETFAAVRSSRFLREELAAIDAGLPTFAPPDDTSQRVFVRGRNTYLELFRPDNRFGEPVGKVGIATGVDEPEQLDCVERRWQALEGEVHRELIERRYEGGSVPWYEALYRPSTSRGNALVLWATAYRREFLPWLYPDREAAASAVRRADVLARRFVADRLLEDVVEVAVAVDVEVAVAIAEQLVAVGYDRVEQDGAVVLRTGGWALRLLPAKGAALGLVRLDLTTTRDVSGHPPVPIGPRSSIVFGPGRLASWRFELP